MCTFRGGGALAHLLPLAQPLPRAVCGPNLAPPPRPCSCLPWQTKFKGCCCEACQDAPRLLRPAKTAGQYGNWSAYVEGEGELPSPLKMVPAAFVWSVRVRFWAAAACGPFCGPAPGPPFTHGTHSTSPPPACDSSILAGTEQANQIISLGRGEGRISRRRKRQQALKDREQAKRAVKVQPGPAEHRAGGCDGLVVPATAQLLPNNRLLPVAPSLSVRLGLASSFALSAPLTPAPPHTRCAAYRWSGGTTPRS